MRWWDFGIPARTQQPLPKWFLGWGWTLSNYTFFRAFQIPHDTNAHFSKSILESLYTNILNNKKKSLASFGHFWIFPEHKAHMFLAKGHSHSKWPADSCCWQHSSHRASTFTLLQCRLSLVGNIFEPACQMNLRTFGGTFSFQIFFQWVLSVPTVECSTWFCSCSLMATW